MSGLGDLPPRLRCLITQTRREHVSPFAVPVLLEIGKEPVYGEAMDSLLEEAASELLLEAME